MQDRLPLLLVQTGQAPDDVCRVVGVSHYGLPSPQDYRGQGKYVTKQGKTIARYNGPDMPDFKANNPDWLARFPVPT